MTRVRDLIDQLKMLDQDEEITFEYFTKDDLIDEQPTKAEFAKAIQLSRNYIFDGALDVIREAIDDIRRGK
jgi:hypothetical protein